MTINNGHLNGEEYKAYRKVLGFSQQEAQNFHGLKDIQSVRRWEKGKNTTSACACEKILKCSKLVYEYLKDKFFEFRQHRSQASIFLSYNDDEDPRYILPIVEQFYSLSVYKMAVYRGYVEAIQRGFDAHIVLFDKDEYESYLEAHNLKDFPIYREDWARFYYNKIKRQA